MEGGKEGREEGMKGIENQRRTGRREEGRKGVRKLQDNTPGSTHS